MSQCRDQGHRKSSKALCSVLFGTLCRCWCCITAQCVQIRLHLTQHGLQQAQTGLIPAERGNRGAVQLWTLGNTLPASAGVITDPVCSAYKRRTTDMISSPNRVFHFGENPSLADITWLALRRFRIKNLRNQDWCFLSGVLRLTLSGPNTLNSHGGIESWNDIR